MNPCALDHSLITCSIDFNIVNIHHTVGMYFLILTGNRDDIEWHNLQRKYHAIHDTLPAPLGVYWAVGRVFLATLPRRRISGTHPCLEKIDNAPATHWLYQSDKYFKNLNIQCLLFIAPKDSAEGACI